MRVPVLCDCWNGVNFNQRLDPPRFAPRHNTTLLHLKIYQNGISSPSSSFLRPSYLGFAGADLPCGAF